MSASLARRVRARAATAGVIAVVAGARACMEAPPKIAAIPASGLSLRVYAFGASAQDARRAFEAVHQNNSQFKVVNEGGDGEVVIGLENDSPKCVQPTALCSLEISYRIRDNKGNVLRAATTTVSASADRCSEICSKALINVAVKVVEAAAAVIEPRMPSDASVESAEGGALAETPPSTGTATSSDAGAPAAVFLSSARAPKKLGAKPGEPPPPKAPPAMCIVGAGPRLPADEAEKRAAQVEVLKRLGILDHEEYDCLRKAYLARL